MRPAWSVRGASASCEGPTRGLAKFWVADPIWVPETLSYISMALIQMSPLTARFPVQRMPTPSLRSPIIEADGHGHTRTNVPNRARYHFSPGLCTAEKQQQRSPYCHPHGCTSLRVRSITPAWRCVDIAPFSPQGAIPAWSLNTRHPPSKCCRCSFRYYALGRNR
jgi:hypothetical protein